VSERTRRIDHLLQEEISAIIAREVHDPRIGFVTITAVKTTPDLRHATVFASVIGDAARRKASLEALGRAMPFVRHSLGSLRLKRIPELHLREDDSAQRGTRVMRLLEQVEAELEGAPATEVGDPAATRDLPTPNALDAPPEAGDEPLPAGYRRRVDRVSLRKARRRRGR
jgi:ribosome-binding factor A